jgi:histidine triad (HIT) family protein
MVNSECVFFGIVEGSVPACIVHEDELTMAFVDLRQFDPGHALVIPRRHLRDVRELDVLRPSSQCATLRPAM